MGSGSSAKQPSEVQQAQENIKCTQAQSNVAQAEELNKTMTKFNYLKQREGRDPKSTMIAAQSVRLLPELSIHPFFGRIIEVMFEEDGHNEINFEQFTKVLWNNTQFISYFNPETPIDVKCKLLFQALDADKDGNLSFNDLFLFYSRYVFAIPRLNASNFVEQSCTYPIEDLNQIVKQIFELYDVDKDEMLSYKEYTDAITDWDVKEFIDVNLI